MTTRPGRYDLRTYRGDTYTWTFKLWQDKAKTLPVDLGGCTVAAEVRTRSGGEVLVTLDCVIEPPNIIHANSDEDLSEGRWDLQLTTADGNVRTVLAGAVYVTGDI